MRENKLIHISLVSRLLLGFLFIYHGLVPKILWLSPVEIHLVSASGLGIPAAVASPLAGVGEIILGIVIIVFRRRMLPVFLAAGALVVLLIYVAVVTPEYLVGAFNPVSTNALGLGLCYIIWSAHSGEIIHKGSEK